MINPGLSNERVEDKAFINYSISRMPKNAHLRRNFISDFRFRN